MTCEIGKRTLQPKPSRQNVDVSNQIPALSAPHPRLCDAEGLVEKSADARDGRRLKVISVVRDQRGQKSEKAGVVQRTQRAFRVSAFQNFSFSVSPLPVPPSPLNLS